ncbi:iron ABC transporter permease [Paenibacillus sedimenti]|uniref:Iron ABC transporter permease n=1 Tax=Paenibacillus sedimenti TaxID=2770274 RepID=A0A926KVL5_9BACL|nr:iron ABC transporter permease [Paenibacillus sedimenti]MBD0383986.1 iron ABC transporter permease [Paenibacillus sedimenti]
MISVPSFISKTGWKAGLVFGGGFILLGALMFASLIQGEADLTVFTAVDALLNPQDTLAHHLVRGIRLPRAVMGLLAGAALAVSGALLQTVTRNPLASASTLGLNAGAYFIIVLAAVFFPGLKADAPLLLALVGACGAAAMAYLMAGGRKSTPVRMALAGMIVSLVLASFTSALQLLYENETNGLFVWGSGSLLQNNWAGVRYSWVWILIGITAACLFARTLDLLELGEETARSLGQTVNGVRFGALASAVLLAGVTVSVVGPIGFVGLIAPHLIRLIGFRRHRLLLPASGLWGAVVLVGADMIARMFRSMLGELPAGAVTAVIGAPWLIWLAVRGAKEQRSTEGNSSMSIGILRKSIPYPAMVALTGTALCILILAGLMAGAMKLPLTEVWAVITGGGSDISKNIVFELRLPRMLVAALAGAVLAVAGVMMQGAVRNPLADPSVVGVTAGAGFGALLLLVIWPQAPGSMLPAAALAGAVMAAGSVYAISWRKGLNPVVLALVGIAVSAVGSAGIQFLVIKSGIAAAPALAWLAGSTYARGWEELIRLSIPAVLLLPAAWVLGRKVDLLAFGDQISLGLGLKLQRTRLTAAIIGVALAAVAVAGVGTVGFIGLLAPHVVRLFVGQNHRQSVLLSSIIGALLLVGADIIGKVIISPKEVPSGIVVALIGTPYLLLLMYRSAVRK